MHSSDSFALSRPAGGRSPRPLEAVAVFVIGLACFAAWAVYAGPDLNFDFLNYHLYLGLHASGKSIAYDFFPAGVSSYLSPYAYWPIGAMVAAHWPGMLVGACLGALHSLSALATWYVARQLFAEDSRKGVMLRAAATAIAVLCPLVMTEAGTSFADIISATPAILGVGLMLGALRADPRRMVKFGAAGFCFGLATALKLTNAPYAVAAALVMTLLWMIRGEVNWKALIIFGVGVATGFVAGYGYWGWQVWQEFGNPVFPFFDSLFHSGGTPAAAPSAPSAGATVSGFQALPGRFWDGLLHFRSALHQRFLPHGIEEWLLRPLYMLDPVVDVYTEVRAPDARFLALFCLIPFALWSVRGRLRSSGLAVLLLFFVIGWVFWMWLFGNGRYLMPLALLAGPALVGCADACWRRQSIAALIAIAVFVLVQAALLIEGAQFRWAGSAWQEHWIDAALPREVTDRPATFVTFDGPSGSWLSAFVHPSSRFAFPGGLHAQSGSSNNAKKFTRIMEQSPDIYAVFTFGYFVEGTEQPYPPSPRHLEVMATRIGLQVDFDSCRPGHLIESKPEFITEFSRNGTITRLAAVQGVFFCRATYRPEIRHDQPADPVRESAFDNIERACPAQFPPGSAGTMCANNACWRMYSSTDILVNIGNDGAVTARRYSAFQQPYLGKVEDLARDATGIECQSELGRYVPWTPGANLLVRPKPPK